MLTENQMIDRARLIGMDEELVSYANYSILFDLG